MRLYSSAIWLSSASLASIAVASGINFNKADFDGAIIYYNGAETYTTILNITQIETGNNHGQWTFTWGPSIANSGPIIKSVILALEGTPDKSIAYGRNETSQSTASGISSLTGIGDGNSQKQFPVDWTGGSLSFGPDFVNAVLTSVQKQALFFQVGWTDSTGSGYSYSLPWAVADDSEASQVLSGYPSMTTDGSPAYPQGTSPQVTTGALPTTTGTASSSSSTSTATTASSSAGTSGSKHKSKSGGLSTGAIVGIVIGVVAALMIISLIAGWFCLRRRRRNNASGEAGSRDAQAMKGMMAEKEARVGILEGDQPDTPYSERAPPNQLGGRGLGLAGMNESGVDMGVGNAASADAIVPCDGHYAVGNDRGSGAYAPASSDSSPTHTHPSSSIHERRPSVPCASAQPDHAYAPYADHPVPGAMVGGITPAQQQQQQQYGYGQHQHVAEGSNHVHQEHFDEDAARGVPSDDHQPISPESARESAGGTPRTREAAFGSRSATPSGISGRYAHLVEEGMTCDEIRRLEEEERALDEAIEQHGRVR